MNEKELFMQELRQAAAELKAQETNAIRDRDEAARKLKGRLLNNQLKIVVAVVVAIMVAVTVWALKSGGANV